MLAKLLTTFIALLVAAEPAAAETLRIEVARVEAGLDQVSGQPIITVELSPNSRAAFADFTKARVGERILVRLGSDLLTDLVIREPIAGGILAVTGEFTEESAAEMAQRIQASGAVLDVEGSDK